MFDSLNYLDKYLAGGLPANRGDEWQPLLTYRNSLVQGEEQINPITLKQASAKRYGKRTKADGQCSGLVTFMCVYAFMAPSVCEERGVCGSVCVRVCV